MAEETCCCARKHTPRSEELKRDIEKRINRAVGQLNGIKAISREIMQDHLETCVVEQVQAGNTEIVGEVMDLLKKFS